MTNMNTISINDIIFYISLFIVAFIVAFIGGYIGAIIIRLVFSIERKKNEIKKKL